jgi:hypothetical protein
MMLILDCDKTRFLSSISKRGQGKSLDQDPRMSKRQTSILLKTTGRWSPQEGILFFYGVQCAPGRHLQERHNRYRNGWAGGICYDNETMAGHTAYA